MNTTRHAGASLIRSASSRVILLGRRRKLDGKQNNANRGYYRIPARAGWNDFTWSTATISANEPATKDANGPLRRVCVDVGADAAAGYGIPGQFVQVRMGAEGKPAFLALANAPGKSGCGDGTLELLVKSVPGSTAEEVCSSAVGTVVEASPVMGKGFALEGAADGKPSALVFATGSGISPIRALLTSGALDGKSVRLYYGTANEEATAFLAESATWGCETVRVYSDGSGRHVQDALKEDIAKGLIDGANAFAVLCGQKEMTDDVKAILAGAGVDESAMVMNF